MDTEGILYEKIKQQKAPDQSEERKQQRKTFSFL